MTTTMTQPPEPRIGTQRALSPRSGANDGNGNEKFPSFDDTPPNLTVSAVATESPLEISPVVPESKWPVRKSSQRGRDPRQTGIYGHRQKRSVSEAIHRFRTRQGSVSENAQELAEALKAPISYRLIVCLLRRSLSQLPFDTF